MSYLAVSGTLITANMVVRCLAISLACVERPWYKQPLDIPTKPYQIDIIPPRR